MDYAIAHAPKGISFVVSMQEGDRSPTILRLKNDPAAPAKSKEKSTFLEKLTEGDRVFLELGGPSDRLALAAYAHGAVILRYPSFLLNRDATMKIVSGAGIAWKEEKAAGTEQTDVLTARKLRALALHTLGRNNDAGFYALSDKDLSLLQLAMAWRSYERSYKGTQRAYLGVLSAYRDQTFVELALSRQLRADAVDETMHNRVLELLLEDMLGGEVNETERKDFFAMIGKEFEGGQLPKRATEETVATIVNALLESDTFKSTVFGRLKTQKKHIERLLQGGRVRVKGEKATEIPANEIYEKVFEPIHGCGPLIAARIISSVGDIRRFETFPKLKAFAGYHHFEDGSRARRVSGKVSNWSPTLKQGVYLFCDITVKQSPETPWRRKLDSRKAYELVKLLADRQAQATELGLDAEILPKAWAERNIASVNDVVPADYAVLCAHVDALQKLAGVAWKGDDEAEEDEAEATATAADPRLGKLVRGLKGRAHQKGLRWLGQQFLKHVFVTWREALGIHDPERSQREARTTRGPSISSEIGTDNAPPPAE